MPFLMSLKCSYPQDTVCPCNESIAYVRAWQWPGVACRMAYTDCEWLGVRFVHLLLLSIYDAHTTTVIIQSYPSTYAYGLSLPFLVRWQRSVFVGVLTS